MAKRKNPTVAMKQSDINRMKKEITKSSVEKAFIIFFTVMHDKWGFGQERLARLLQQIIDLSEMIDQTPHYVTLEQLKKTLRDELGIYF